MKFKSNIFNFLIVKELKLIVLCIALSLLLPVLLFGQHHGHQNEWFVQNNGQWHPAVKFKLQLAGNAIFLEENGFMIVFPDHKVLKELFSYKYLSANEKKKRKKLPETIKHHASRIVFSGRNNPDSIIVSGAASDYNNYYMGNDPSLWRSKVPKYSDVTYVNMYDDIDVRFHIHENRLNYDFILKPGSSPASISLGYEGMKSVTMKKGKLVFLTELGEFVELKPIAFQYINNTRNEIDCKFRLKKGKISIEVMDDYNMDAELIIDPVLVFASYSGSTADNWGYTATYDEQGFLYAAGTVFGTGYPIVPGSYEVNFSGGISDIGLTKYDTTGRFLIYSTYLGGSGTEVPSSLIVNNSNELILLGTTGSSDFPTTSNAWDNVFSGGTTYTLSSALHFQFGSDIVLSKFKPDGTDLLASTFVGGTGNDGLNAYSPLQYNYADDVRGEVMNDNQDNVYIVSSTRSTDFPATSGTYSPNFLGGDQDACVFVISNDLSTPLWGAYVGGNGRDAGYSIVLGENGSVYVAGGTTSTNFPTSIVSMEPTYNGGNCDGFISRISPDGNNLQASTYFGSNRYDQVYMVKKDRNNNIYVFGQTGDTSNKYSYNSTWGTPHGGQFITKLPAGLNQMLWSVSFGIIDDNPDISPSAFMIDLCDNVYLSAWGGPNINGFGGVSGLPLSSNALQVTTDNNDYYFLVIDGSASTTVFGSYYGGTSSEHVDGGTSRFDRKGIIYQSVCAGCGGNDDFPTTDSAWSTVNGSSNCNNGVIKLDFELPLVIADFELPPSGCTPYTVNFVNKSKTTGSPGIFCQWDFGDGNISNQCDPTHTYTQSGIYEIFLSITDTGSCNYFDTISRFLVVLSGAVDTLPQKHICYGEYIQIGLPPTPDTSIDYTWSPSTGLNDPSLPNPIASPLSTTDYNVIVSNGSCSDTLYQRVNVYDIIVDAGTDTSICDTVVTLHATANIAGLYYCWSSYPDFSDTLNLPGLSNIVTVPVPGPSTFYVKAFNDYCDAFDSVYIDFVILISPAVTVEPTCYGYCDGMASVVASGGSLPYTYAWSNGQTGDTAFNLCAGTYFITITDADQCQSVTRVDISEPTPITINPEVVNIPCEEVCIGSIKLYPSGSMPPYTYTWSNGQNSESISDLCKGGYSITITDSRNCTFSDTFFVDVDYVFENMLIGATEDTIYEGQSTILYATDSAGLTYLWTPTLTLETPSQATTVASPASTQVYSLLVEDANGCQFIGSVKITVIDVICGEPYIYIPNAFTPNGDNSNDVLYVRGNIFDEIKLLIYNRWGEKVFETDDKNKGWDGKFKGEYCDPGVFVYYLEVICFNQVTFTKKGNITLIR